MQLLETEKFGFTVNYSDPDSYGGEGYTVSLPHQCDDWMITDGYSAVTKEDAIASLKAFISEANDALSALEEIADVPS